MYAHIVFIESSPWCSMFLADWRQDVARNMSMCWFFYLIEYMIDVFQHRFTWNCIFFKECGQTAVKLQITVFFLLVFCNMPTAFVIRSTKSLKCMCTCKLVWIVLLWVPTWQQNMWVHWASKWAVSDQAEVKIKSCECRQCQREFVCILWCAFICWDLSEFYVNFLVSLLFHTSVFLGLFGSKFQ